MSVESMDNELIGTVEMVMAVEAYDLQEKQEWEQGIEFVTTESESEDKVLFRIVTDPTSRSGIIGIDTVKAMNDVLESEAYDRGVLIGRRFSKAAREEMGKTKDLQYISEELKPAFKPEQLYLVLQEHINAMCQTKCGLIPITESDCKGYTQSYYTCTVRRVSDNASFHFNHGWTNLLKKDLEKLIALGRSFHDDPS